MPLTYNCSSMFNSLAILQSEEVASFWSTAEITHPSVGTISTQFIVGSQLHACYEMRVVSWHLG